MKTSQIFRLFILVSALIVLATTVASASISGTWSTYPVQTESTTTTTTSNTVYKVSIQQPINSDGTSNFKSTGKSVIPVKFSLASATETTTDVATTVGPFSFVSNTADTNPDNDYAFVSFAPSAPLTFNQLTNLSAVYDFTSGDCYGGSLRWSVRIDVNDTPLDQTDDQPLWIYYGTPPQFGNGGTGGCDDANNQNNVNLINQPDLRYDTTALGGTFYDNYTHALVLAGSHQVVRASLVLDSGWVNTQDVALSSATVNDNTFTPKAAGTTHNITTVTGSYASTCALPPATIQITKLSGAASGDVNEPETIQPNDNNGVFRVVDCKYMYNLATSSLSGVGSYKVEVVINLTPVPDAALFELR